MVNMCLWIQSNLRKRHPTLCLQLAWGTNDPAWNFLDDVFSGREAWSEWKGPKQTTICHRNCMHSASVFWFLTLASLSVWKEFSVPNCLSSNQQKISMSPECINAGIRSSVWHRIAKVHDTITSFVRSSRNPKRTLDPCVQAHGDHDQLSGPVYISFPFDSGPHCENDPTKKVKNNLHNRSEKNPEGDCNCDTFFLQFLKKKPDNLSYCWQTRCEWTHFQGSKEIIVQFKLQYSRTNSLCLPLRNKAKSVQFDIFLFPVSFIVCACTV